MRRECSEVGESKISNDAAYMYAHHVIGGTARSTNIELVHSFPVS